MLDKNNEFAFANDLGIDKVMIYQFDDQSGKLKPNVGTYLSEKAPQMSAKLLRPDFGGINKQTGSANHPRQWTTKKQFFWGWRTKNVYVWQVDDGHYLQLWQEAGDPGAALFLGDDGIKRVRHCIILQYEKFISLILPFLKHLQSTDCLFYFPLVATGDAGFFQEHRQNFSANSNEIGMVI